ncbi:PMD domain-containing protein [Cephalotus follicularis]|uniref:PMD domain-containing protein n=1 Tax=Cephalotus follicularis TaxID=3775 RepID=A0A1Q3BP04_CEPFO|nr:PMD domain-containing protein [Cephalotus follicularis]
MHTFIAAWGFFSVTLEDVTALYHLPLIGDLGVSNIIFSNDEQDQVATLCDLITVAWKHRFQIVPEDKTVSSAPPNSWIHYFFQELDKNNKAYESDDLKANLKLSVFLAMWLLRHVFPGSPQDRVS